MGMFFFKKGFPQKWLVGFSGKPLILLGFFFVKVMKGGLIYLLIYLFIYLFNDSSLEFLTPSCDDPMIPQLGSFKMLKNFIGASVGRLYILVVVRGRGQGVLGASSQDGRILRIGLWDPFWPFLWLINGG